MRRIISILFLSLLLLQAIPVLHFFSSQKEVFYSYVDEEKPDSKVKEKKDGKEYLSLEALSSFVLHEKNQFARLVVKQYNSPHLDLLTPPPDAC